MVQKEKRDTKRDKNDHNRGVGKYHIRVTVFTLRNLSFFSSKSANNFSTVTMISQTERKSHWSVATSATWLPDTMIIQAAAGATWSNEA